MAEKRKLLTVEQAAAELNLRPKTIRQKVWLREIEYHKIGRSIRISQDVINRIIEESTVPARPAA